MKKTILHLFTIGTSLLLISAFVFAQSNKPAPPAGSAYIISANAGGVNYVEGKVSVSQNNGRNGYLIKGDKLQVGEKVSTGADGKAEILLNPGSYIRLAENSGFEFLSTSLDDLQINLNTGSAMFEVITDDDFNFTVNTPKGHFNILKSGVYRIDVSGNGTSRIEVWKGKARIGETNAVDVKSGRAATVNGSQVTVEKFDRDDKDTLEVWSKVRAKELAKVNSRLERGSLRNTLLSSFDRQGWNLYDSYGLWVYDRFSSNYCFLPFGYGWSSPYGYGYGRDLWYLRMPQFIYYQPPTGPASQIATIRSGAGTPMKSGRMANSESIIPPYRKIQNDIDPSPIFRDDSPAVFNNNTRFPTRVPDSQPASAPASTTMISPASRPGKGDQ